MPVAATLPRSLSQEDLKNEAVVDVESRRDFTQQMVDMIYSFNELGFQEFETQRYVTGILEDNGFTVEPELVEKANDYFENVQQKGMEYTSFLRPQDEPAVWLNEAIMRQFKPELEQYYFDPSTYDTYLEQLGIEYPTTRE